MSEQRSTTELRVRVVGLAGIEPASSAHQTGVLTVELQAERGCASTRGHRWRSKTLGEPRDDDGNDGGHLHGLRVSASYLAKNVHHAFHDLPATPAMSPPTGDALGSSRGHGDSQGRPRKKLARVFAAPSPAPDDLDAWTARAPTSTTVRKAELHDPHGLAVGSCDTLPPNPRRPGT